MTRTNTYDDPQFARLYDFIIEKLGESEMEVPFWLSVAGAFKGRILEMGCGTGRLLLQFATHGYDAAGLDSSGPMLDILAEKLAGLPLSVRAHISYHCGDMVNPAFATREQYGLVCFCGSQFLHLKSDRERLACLMNVRQLLLPGGAVVLSNSRLEGRPTRKFTVLSTEAPNAPVVEWRRSVSNSRCTVTFKVSDQHENHREQRFLWTLYRVDASHMKTLIRRAGLQLLKTPLSIVAPQGKPKDLFFCRVA